MDKLKSQESALKDTLPTYDKYLKLLQSAPVILGKMDNMKAMDIIFKTFFSNLTITDHGKDSEQRYEIVYKLKEPWDGFLKSNNVIRGRGERTRTFDLTVPNRAR